MMTETTNPTARKRPVIAWFIVFFVALGASLFTIDVYDIKDPLIANGLVILPMVFMVKAGLNAASNAGGRGDAGAPTRRYLIRMILVSISYVGSLAAASMLIEDDAPVTVLSILITMVPGIAVAAYFWAMGKYIQEQDDEFLRMLMVRQSLIATAIAFSAASVWGFLESFGQVPHLDAYWWPIIWFFGIGIGAIANKLQFGTVGEL